MFAWYMHGRAVVVVVALGRARGGQRQTIDHLFQIAPPMDNAAPPPPPPAHVVGADGGTIADGDARARADSRARERAVAGLAAVNNAAADFFAAPVGPAFPPGHVPNFNAAAAPLFNPGNMLAMMQAMPPLGVHVPMPPLPAPPTSNGAEAREGPTAAKENVQADEKNGGAEQGDSGERQWFQREHLSQFVFGPSPFFTERFCRRRRWRR